MPSPTQQALLMASAAGGGGACPPATTFDLATVASATLSGGNLTVTNTGTSGFLQGALGLASSGETTGKYYYEITFVTSVSPPALGSNFNLGVMAVGGDLSARAPISTFVLMQTVGQINSNSINYGSLNHTGAAGDIYGFAIDMTNRLFWTRVVNGSGQAAQWNGNNSTNNPASALGGALIQSGSMVPFVGFGGSGQTTGNVFTANFGGSAFVGAVPAGFSPCGWPLAASGGDPFWYNTVLLLGFEGVNGSTGAPGMSDESPEKTLNGTGAATGATIDTSQFKFGSSSLHTVSASNGSLQFNVSSHWILTGRFTIEAWVNFNTLTAATHFLIANWISTAAAAQWSISVNASGQLVWTVSTTGSNTFNDITAAWSPSTGTWYHIAVDYDGTKYRAYINGTMVGSSTTARVLFDPGVKLALGSNSLGNASFFDGWLDEVRITKNVARYASDAGFTVPTAAFPRTGPAPAGLATWSPDDKNTNITLSGANLTATCGASSNMAVRATKPEISGGGKFYFEVTVGATYAGTNTAFGIGTAHDSIDTIGVPSFIAASGFAVLVSGNVTRSGVLQNNIGALVAGDVVGIAIDMVNLTAWARRNVGNWNNSGAANPATNVGGIDISAIFATVPAWPFQAFNSSGSLATANFGATAFVNGAPAGFTSW